MTASVPLTNPEKLRAEDKDIFSLILIFQRAFSDFKYSSGGLRIEVSSQLKQQLISNVFQYKTC